MVEAIAKIIEVAANGIEKLSEAASEVKSRVDELDKPLNDESFEENDSVITSERNHEMKKLDSPLNLKAEPTKDIGAENAKPSGETKEVEKLEKMEPQITIEFKCPEGMDKKEFTRQVKAQERGLNSQTVAENMDNRAAFEQRKAETGNGRDLTEGKKAQDIAREKATQSRIESNQKKGMSYSEAKAEASEWIKTQAALHNPDQIAGGDPSKVSRMGDANVNSSIGSQWRTRVNQLADSIEDFAKDKTREELENTKMNVKLVVV